MSKKKIASESNRQKAIAGSEMHKNVTELLTELQAEGIIKKFNTNISFRHQDYSYEKQFLANFSIETYDNKYIFVRSSTSFRTDRVKIGFYDFEGIVNHSSFSADIIATVYLVPDSELSETSFINTREQIKSKEYYSPATHLLCISEFISFLEGYKYDLISKKVKPLTSDKLAKMTPEERGSYYGKSGNELERHIVSLLSDHNNLIKLKEETLDESHYKIIIDTILAEKKLDLKELMEVKATNTVPLLKNGGNAKTDIILYLKFVGMEQIVETISIKNTKAKKVSCHDYKSEDFIRVLDCEGSKLAEYLSMFQKNPTLGKFEKSLTETYSVKEFTTLLKAKSDIFNSWVLSGAGDLINLTVPDLQISNFLLLNTPEKIAFYSIDRYLSVLYKDSKLTYGVPFSWTYPSKQNGNRIQLKLPVIL